MVEALNNRRVDFVVVGAFAVIYYGAIRLTEDIDFLVMPTPENTNRLKAALIDFGSPISIERAGLDPNEIVQIGVKPVRIDIISSISGITTEEIWNQKIAGTFGGKKVWYISMDLLLKNKLATGRTKDKADAENLQRIKKRQEESGG